MWKFTLLFLILFMERFALTQNSVGNVSNVVVDTVFLRKAARGALMQKYMDLRIDPCEDFYQYACGNYPKTNPPKSKESSSYSPFASTEDRITDYIIDMLSKENNEFQPSNETESALKLENQKSILTKTKNYFDSCLKADVFSFRKIPEYLDLLQTIGGCSALTMDWDMEKFDWLPMIAHMRTYGAIVLIKEEVLNTTNGVYKIALDAPEVPLESATLEDLENPKSKPYLLNEIIIKRILILYGVHRRRASKYASNIMGFMKRLQKLIDYEDPDRVDGISEPRNIIPQIDWEKYFSILLGRQGNKTLNLTVYDTKYFQTLPSLILRSDMQTVSNYIAVKFLYALHYEFQYSKYPTKFCAQVVQENLQPVTIAMFMKRYYKKELESEILEMVTNIKESFKEILNTTSWLDKRTKINALNKLRATNNTIGVVGDILSFDVLTERYADLYITSDNYYQNYLNVHYFNTRREHKTKGQDKLDPPDISLVDVNAYYEVDKNNIVIPAGIMLPPFYHNHLPKAYTYGLIGTVIGHELTHGFDNTGRQFDEFGAEVNWWSKVSLRLYNRRTQCMIDQYNNYKVPELATYLNGEKTLGENIADNGGIRQSFNAYKKWYARQNSSDLLKSERLPGLPMTNTQLFFLSFAQGYCSHITQSDLEYYATGEHSLNKYRIIGTLSNFEEFSAQFNCSLGSPMNPVDKCRVW